MDQIDPYRMRGRGSGQKEVFCRCLNIKDRRSKPKRRSCWKKPEELERQLEKSLTAIQKKRQRYESESEDRYGDFVMRGGTDLEQIEDVTLNSWSHVKTRDEASGPATVPFRSIRQSRVTGHFQTPKSHGGHGDFDQLPKPLKNRK